MSSNAARRSRPRLNPRSVIRRAASLAATRSSDVAAAQSARRSARSCGRTVARRPVESCSTVANSLYPSLRSERTRSSLSASPSTATAISTSRVKRGSARAETANPPTSAQVLLWRSKSAAVCRNAAESTFMQIYAMVDQPRHPMGHLVSRRARLGRQPRSLHR